MSLNWNGTLPPGASWRDLSTVTWEPNKVVEYAIKGEMILVSYTIKESNTPLDKDEIKKLLARELAGYILENKMVEFTQIGNVYTGDTTVRARCYLVPSKEVQIIREFLKK